jgi:hypothetical protein
MLIPCNYPIPTQLRVDTARFVKVNANEKVPSEINWQENNYRWNEPELVKHILDGGNYGFLPVAGCDISVIDIDGSTEGVFETFTVRSGSGTHSYIRCRGVSGKTLIFNDNGDHVGEFFAPGAGAYVVGPGSVHPDGQRYEVLCDLPIATVTPDELNRNYTLFNTFIREAMSDVLGLRIEEMAMPSNPTERGDDIQGGHPLHGSSTGLNFSINTRLNRFWCHRCDVGGDPIVWLAIKLGIQSEESIRESGLLDSSFEQVIEYLRANGHAKKLALFAR